MKNLKKLAAAVLLMCVFGLPALAGQTDTPPCTPGEVNTPPCSTAPPADPGDSTEASATPGQTETPPSADVSVSEIETGVLFNLLTIF